MERGSSYVSRNAAAIGSRAARIAGKSPPSNPSIAAHAIALVNRAGVTANANAIWLNVCQFIVAALKPSNAKYAAAAPTTPHASPSLSSAAAWTPRC